LGREYRAGRRIDDRQFAPAPAGWEYFRQLTTVLSRSRTGAECAEGEGTSNRDLAFPQHVGGDVTDSNYDCDPTMASKASHH
jgi:hypothetical protein